PYGALEARKWNGTPGAYGVSRGTPFPAHRRSVYSSLPNVELDGTSVSASCAAAFAASALALSFSTSDSSSSTLLLRRLISLFNPALSRAQARRSSAYCLHSLPSVVFSPLDSR